MPIPLPDDLLDRPAEEAVRRIALVELERAETARAALVAGDDPEALHDFRVAVRRLRSLLRAFREEAGEPLGKRLRQKLAEIAADTNPGRDAEVAVAWVEELGAEAKPSERRGIEWFRERLAGRRDEAYRKVEREIVADFGALAARLRERLSRYRVELRLDGEAIAPILYRAALADELERHTAELARALGCVVSVADEREGHRARIEAKRLRYLLEPAAPWLDGAKRTIGRLKELQDRLGELHDLQLLAAEVAQAVAEAESERARRVANAALAGDPDGSKGRAEMRRSERPGLLALARRIAARRDAIFAAFEQRWLGPDAVEPAELRGEVAGLLGRLRATATAA